MSKKIDSKVITVVNQKGGVAKTTTCRYLADIFVDKGYKVLLIDFDPQASLTKGLQLDPILFEGKNESNISNIFKKESVSVLDIPVAHGNGILHLVPANRDLGTIGDSQIIGKDLMLKKFITEQRLKSQYDVIIIDNNPKFDSMNINTILASDILVVPVTTAMDEQAGLAGFFRNTEELLNIYGHCVEKMVIIPTKYNKTKKVASFFLDEIMDETPRYLEANCPTLSTTKTIITSPIPEMGAFQDAASYYLSVYRFLKDFSSNSSLKKDKREELINLLEQIASNIIK